MLVAKVMSHLEILKIHIDLVGVARLHILGTETGPIRAGQAQKNLL